MGLSHDQQIALGRLPLKIAKALFEGIPIWIEVLWESKGLSSCGEELLFGLATGSIEFVDEKT
jgi:hypothetical protein